MLYNIRKIYNQKKYNRATNAVRKKLNVFVDPSSSFVLLTQLCNTDVNMYLVALGTFTQFMKPKKIIIVSDNLSKDNLEVLRNCVPDIIIIPITKLGSKELPSGGTWERLICILSMLKENYVIQMDSDILMLNEPYEVKQAVEQNISFTITSKLGFEKMSFINASYLIWERESSHVQVAAEKAFKSCDNAETRLYIRACSGFTGFAKNSSTLDKLIKFSQEIESKIGKEKWKEWGSEQISSNYLIANSKSSVILPYNSYPFFEPGVNTERVKLLHFIGTHRYKKGMYIRLSKEFVNTLVKNEKLYF